MSKKSSVDEYLQQGIYGVKDIKPEERNRYLGTLRERVVIALTKQQVREPGTYKQVEDKIKSNPNATLYLNGHMNYAYLSDYIKLANRYGNRHTSVSNMNVQTDLGLVLAYDYAVDHEDIFIKKETKESDENRKGDNFFTNFFKGLF